MTVPNEWVEPLLAWFGRCGRKLPWRGAKPRDPYHVWVSEIMLQQTRTETVKAYFTRWMALFPTVADLARAEEENVLRAWQGLGYYSRARNLLRAAREIAVRCGGRIPSDVKTLKSLPGIGEYTVGAIASLAYGRPVPAVDGNLLRVLARLYAVEADILSPEGKKRITGLAERVIPPDRPGDFNEALMDLGAEICIPKAPRCTVCPLQHSCEARRRGLETVLPVRKPRRAQEVFYAACLVARRGDQVLLHHRPARGMLASLWELPTYLAGSEEASCTLAREAARGVLGSPVWTHRHVFTHQIWYMKAYPVRLEELPGPAGEYTWAGPDERERLPLCGPCSRFFAEEGTALF